jgi:hypothetical protein
VDTEAFSKFWRLCYADLDVFTRLVESDVDIKLRTPPDSLT